MNNKNLEKIKKYVTEHYSNKASFLLRKTSLLRGLANAMGCHAYMTNNNHREEYFLINLVKNFDFGNVSLKDVVIWQSSEFKPYGKVLDEFLNAFGCKMLISLILSSMETMDLVMLSLMYHTMRLTMIFNCNVFSQALGLTLKQPKIFRQLFKMLK